MSKGLKAKHLKCYFSTIDKFYDQTKSSTNKVDQTQKSNISQQKIQELSSQNYRDIDYRKIFEENRKRLKQISENINLKEVLFNQEYLKNQLLNTKYFYADILSVSDCVIQYILNKIDQQKLNHLQSPVISSTHIHFLLYIYHLYPKQFNIYRDSFYNILAFYLTNLNKNDWLQVDKNLQFIVYFRRFIDSEVIQGNGFKIIKIAEAYCEFIRSSYLDQLNRLNQSISCSEKQGLKFSIKISLKSKLLQNYLLGYPSLWVSKFSHDQQKYLQKLSQSIIKTYNQLVIEFSKLLNESIHFWLETKIKLQVQDSLAVNFSFKKILIQQFKQQQLNKCFNCLRLVMNRLWVILQTPKMPNQTIQQLNKKHYFNKIEEQYTALLRQYTGNKLNLLKFLPTQITTQDKQIMLMRLLILMKNLLGYHTLKRIDHKQLTLHLQQLFENSQKNLINSQGSDKNKQIKILKGELISRLSSGSWVDEDNILARFF